MHKSSITDWEYIDPTKSNIETEKANLSYLDWIDLMLNKIASRWDISLKELNEGGEKTDA